MRCLCAVTTCYFGYIVLRFERFEKLSQPSDLLHTCVYNINDGKLYISQFLPLHEIVLIRRV